MALSSKISALLEVDSACILLLYFSFLGKHKFISQIRGQNYYLRYFILSFFVISILHLA